MLTMLKNPLSLLCSLKNALNKSKNIRKLATCNGSILQPSFKLAPLKHRSIIQLSGRDTRDFLQGLITNDVHSLEGAKCMYTMLLNPQGRVELDLIMHHVDQESLLLDCEQLSANHLLTLLKRYKLRKKVKFQERNDFGVWQLFSSSNVNNIKTMLSKQQDMAGVILVPDPRVNMLGWRLVMSTSDLALPISAEEHDYHKMRYQLGVSEGVKDLPPGKCLPLESNLDFMNGISFHKGCYLGQELTARTHHTGVIRKRLLPVLIDGSPAPKPGEVLHLVDGDKLSKKRVGRFRSTLDGRHGLALVQLDHVSNPLKTASGVCITCSKPEWWHNVGESFSDGFCETLHSE